MRHSFAVAVGLFLASVCLADPPTPSIALAWKSIDLGNISNTEKKDKDFHKEGSVEVTTTNMELSSSFTGLQIIDGAIVIQGVSAELKYGRISARNTVIIPIPKFLGGGEKKGHTDLGPYDNAGIKISKTDRKPWAIPLPEEVELDYLRAANGETSLAFKDPKAVVSALHKAIDEGFTDAFLDRTVRLDPQNVPGIIGFLVKLKKGDIYGTFRRALKEEVERARFLQGLEVSMSRHLPVLPIEIGGKLSGKWRLKPNADGMMTVVFGSDVSQALLAKTEASERFVSVSNATGMNLIVGLLFDTLARFDGKLMGKGFQIDSGLMSYAPQNDGERAQMASLASLLIEEPVDAKDMLTVSIDISGERTKREIRFVEKKEKRTLEIRLGMVVALKGADPVTVPVVWSFSTGEQGNLILEQIQIEKDAKALDSSFALFKKVEGSFKSNIARFLMNQKFDEFQKQNSKAKAKFSIGRLNDWESGLRLSLQD